MFITFAPQHTYAAELRTYCSTPDLYFPELGEDWPYVVVFYPKVVVASPWKSCHPRAAQATEDASGV
jgi:hypothetical protein